MFSVNVLKRNLNLNLGLQVVLFCAILVFYGVSPGKFLGFPGSVDFGHPSITLSQLFYNKHLGFPLGNYFPEGLPYSSLQYLLCICFHITEYLAYQIVLFGVLLASFIGLTKLLTFFKVEPLISTVLAFVFVMMPINFGHVIGFPPLAFTMLLTPLFLYVDCLVFEAISGNPGMSKRTVWLIVLMLWAKVTAMFGNGYVFVFYNFASLLVLAAFVAKNKRGGIGRSAVLAAAFVITNLIGLLLYKMYVPGGGSYRVEPVEYFRSQGVDLATVLVPGSNMCVANKLGFGAQWHAWQFYGDGSNVEFNYMGITLMGVILFGIYRKLLNSILKKILLAGCLLAFFFSLGPSLKLHDLHEDGQSGEILYHMAEKDATMSLGTAFLYKLPPFNNMRAVYRWLFVSKLLLLVLAGIILSALYREQKTRVYALVATLLVAVDMFPNVSYTNILGGKFYEQGQKFTADVTDKLEPYMKEGRKVFFYSHENDFLSRVMGNRYQATVYNVNGDKKIYLVRESWPEPIKKILKCKSACNNEVYNAMTDGCLDVFIIPRFNLRWNFYNWPPKNEVNNEQVFETGDCRFVVQDEKYFTVVTKSSAPAKPDVIDNDYDFCDNFHKAKVKGQGKMNSPWGKNIAVIIADSSEKNRGLFETSISGISYRVAMPATRACKLSARVGYLPVSKGWNVSDGTRVLVVVRAKGKTDTVFNRYILPADEVRYVSVDMKKYAGSVAEITFKTTQDKGKHFMGDWIVWQEPKLLSKQ